MTNHYIDMKNSNCFLVFSNPAENHPCCMQYVNEARFREKLVSTDEGPAPMLVVEPRRTRMGSMLKTGEERVNGKDAYLRIRPGTDIAFINGLLKRHFTNVDAASTAAYLYGNVGMGQSSIPPGPGAYLRAVKSGGPGSDPPTGKKPPYWTKWTDALFRTNEDNKVHEQNDMTNIVKSPEATDLASAINLVNEIREDYENHRTGSGMHTTDDVTNVVSAGNSGSQATADALADELKVDFNNHRTEGGVHSTDDTTNNVTEGPSDGTPGTLVDLVNDIKAMYEKHRTEASATDYLRYGRDITAPAPGDDNYDNDPNNSWVFANAADANTEQWPVLAPDLNPTDNGTRTVYQVYKERVAVYDSATVADICGCDEELFEQVADTYLNNSWAYTHDVLPDGTSPNTSGESVFPNSDGVYTAATPGGCDERLYMAGSILYAMGSTQHTCGAANVKSFANLQICTGNIGKHGGGVNALRGIGNVQGSTDMNLLYHILMAYVNVSYKVKITGVVDTKTVDVSDPSGLPISSGKPSLWKHNEVGDVGVSNYDRDPLHGGLLTNGYHDDEPEVCCRVLLADKNGFLHSNAIPRTYVGSSAIGNITNCGTPVLSVTQQPSGDWRITTVNNIGNPVGNISVGDYLVWDYETWLLAKSFGGRAVYPTTTSAGGGQGNQYTDHWKFTGGLPWGHMGTWAVIRTFFSEGQGSNVCTHGAGAPGNDTNVQASADVNKLYNKYMPKGNGYDHRAMVHQTDNVGPRTLDGHDTDKEDVNGWLVWGMNPRVTVANAMNVGDALYNLDWLVGVDMFVNETYDADRKTGAPTYFLPAASPIETAGTTSNSGRWIQWRYQAVEPVGDSKTDLEILLKLARAMHHKCQMDFDYTGAAPANYQAAYESIWRDQYAGGGGTAGILDTIAWATALGGKQALADPAENWNNEDYRASYGGEDNGVNAVTSVTNGGLGYPGYSERIMIQTNTSARDMYGNAGTNWLHGNGPDGGGSYGAWHCPTQNHVGLVDNPPQYAVPYTPYNRTQDTNANDDTSNGGKGGLYQAFSWAWLRNRRCFYNSGGFCPDDVGDIFVSPDEVGTLLMAVPGYSERGKVVQYSRCWRGSRGLKDIPINAGDRTWDRLGYMPTHWEPHESPRGDLVAAHAQIGKKTMEGGGATYADDDTDRQTYPLVLTTFRHTEHFQGGVMTRNVPWFTEMVPEAVIEINSVDSAIRGIMEVDMGQIKSMMTTYRSG